MVVVGFEGCKVESLSSKIQGIWFRIRQTTWELGMPVSAGPWRNHGKGDGVA